MLNNLYDVFYEKFKDQLNAWDNMLEFIAVDNNALLLLELKHNFEWLFKDKLLMEEVMKIYNSDLLREDYYDHLGEMYLEKIVSKDDVNRKGLYLTPTHVADAMVQMTIKESNVPLKILDPAVGTGRLLMLAHKKAPNSILFGVDIDLRLLRIAYTNFVLHDIYGFLLHADSLQHEIDISNVTGHYNWQFSNSWYSHIDKLKSIDTDRKTSRVTQLDILT